MTENDFTSHVWWALIEEIVPRAEEMAGEKEIACFVKRPHIWAAAIREVLVCSTEPTSDEKNVVVKIFSFIENI